MKNPHITQITIGRLHNLGNYEHVRYEVSVEIPEGNHAGAVIRKITDLLDDLEPRDPVDDYDYERAKTALAKPVAEWPEWERGNVEAYSETIQKRQEWIAARQAAHAALGNLPVLTEY